MFIENIQYQLLRAYEIDYKYGPKHRKLKRKLELDKIFMEIYISFLFFSEEVIENRTANEQNSLNFYCCLAISADKLFTYQIANVVV